MVLIDILKDLYHSTQKVARSALAGLALAYCGSRADDDRGCDTDTDCHEDRICNYNTGRCEYSGGGNGSNNEEACGDSIFNNNYLISVVSAFTHNINNRRGMCQEAPPTVHGPGNPKTCSFISNGGTTNYHGSIFYDNDGSECTLTRVVRYCEENADLPPDQQAGCRLIMCDLGVHSNFYSLDCSIPGAEPPENAVGKPDPLMWFRTYFLSPERLDCSRLVEQEWYNDWCLCNDRIRECSR